MPAIPTVLLARHHERDPPLQRWQKMSALPVARAAARGGSTAPGGLSSAEKCRGQRVLARPW